jgi:hypothetical protein
MIIRWHPLRRAAVEADAFWVFIAGIFLSAPISYLFTLLFGRPDLATQFRYAGVLLECFGFGMVVLGLEKTRQEFGQPSTLALIKSWVKLFASAFRKPETQTIEVDSAGHLHISTGDVTVILNAPKDAPLEKRIDVLEQNLSRLREDTEKKVARLSDRVSEVNQTVSAHREQWEREQQSTRRQIEQFAVGSSRYEVVGVLWFFLGTVSSNLPEECALIFGLVLAIVF